MSLTIRLAKIGKRNAPTYKVVVAQTKSKRNGKFLEILGDYNPLRPGKPSINKEGYESWVSKGAFVSDSVKSLLEGTYKFKKYSPKGEKTKSESSEASA